MILVTLLLACDTGCREGAYEVDGVCVPDVSLRGADTAVDTGDDTETPETGETGDTGETAEPVDDLDGDGAADVDDCDDDDPAVYPGAEESCDYVDNDCDDEVDEGSPADATVWYADADGDGYGDPDVSQASCFGPFGYVDDAQDCDDADDGVWPGAVERCNGVDDDCDGEADEAAAVDATTWYADGDGDGYGDPDGATVACDAPDGYAAVGTDCDDADGAVNPGTAEVARDGADNDCDGTSNGYGLDGERDLGDADAVFHGGGAGAYAGWTFAAGGDLDGDGAADLVVGAPYASDAAPGGGGLSVVALAATGDVSLDDVTVARHGDTAYDAAGYALAVGDLDGDGTLDVVAGAPGDDDGASDAGAVWLLPGPVTGEATLTGTAARGDRASMGLGRALAVGDVDGDGDAEVLAGAPLADVDGADEGAARLLDGDGTTLAEWTGEAAGDEAGGAVLLGDLDGDGLADVVVGAAAADADGGAVYVLLTGGTLADALASADHTLAGDAAGDAAGAALAAWDVDGDGRDDLLVGAPGASDGAALGGAFYAVTTLATGDLGAVAAWSLAGEETGLHVGAALAAGGDLDGDGAADLLVGAPESDAVATDAGEAFVVFGPFAGGSTFGGRLQGEASSAAAGFAVGFADDPFGDGYDDALIGAYGYDFGGFAAGAAYRMRGGSL